MSKVKQLQDNLEKFYNKKIKFIWPVFITPYSMERNNIVTDLHLVKLIIQFEDQTQVRRVTYIKDYEFPVYVTKPAYRTHKQKKESEVFSKLDTVMVTNKNIVEKVKVRLGPRYSHASNMMILNASPYFYGSITVSSYHLRREFYRTYPDMSMKDINLLVASYDAEWYIDGPNKGKINIFGFSTLNEKHTWILRDLVDGLNMSDEDIQAKLHSLYKDHVPSGPAKNNIKINTYIIVNSEKEILTSMFKKLHEIKPDLLTSYNMSAEIEIIEQACRRNNMKIEDLYKDPDLPEGLTAFYNWSPGRANHVSSSNKKTNKSWEEVWNKLYNCASFLSICSAMVYVQLRKGGGEKLQGGYSLNNFLDKTISAKKLKFNNVTNTNTEGIDWHKFMVNVNPLEYIIYNDYDHMALLDVDESLKELTIALPGGSEYTEMRDLGSTTAIGMHNLSRYLEDNLGKVLAPASRLYKNDQPLGLGTGDWIFTLPSAYTVPNGLPIKNSDDKTLIRLFVLDIDVESSYPTCFIIANASKETTKTEVIRIGNIPKDVFKEQNINLFSANGANSLQYCNIMFNLPDSVSMLDRLSEKYK